MNIHVSTVFITFNCRRAARTRDHIHTCARQGELRLAYHRQGEANFASPRVCVNATLPTFRSSGSLTQTTSVLRVYNRPLPPMSLGILKQNPRLN